MFLKIHIPLKERSRSSERFFFFLEQSFVVLKKIFSKINANFSVRTCVTGLW